MATKTKDNLSYKDLNDELDTIISELQSNDLDIDKVLTEYERGIDVISKLENYLNQAENKVNKLSAKPLKQKT
jgi:exodeoxyribonuclease VII small subunit